VREFKFPDVGEGIHEGTIVKWHVKEGDVVKADQTIVDVETDKAVVELPAPASGTILKINFHEGTLVNVGETLVVIGEPGEKVVITPAQPKPEAPKAAAPATHAEPSAPAWAGMALATPSTRKLAREMNVDITKVKGTGPAGRITDEDVKAAGTAQPQASPGVTAPEAIKTAEGDVRIPLSGIRKTIAERMSYSKTHIPHACGMDFADVTKLVAVRERERHIFEQEVHLTYLPFVVKAVTIALRKFPSFNAHFDNERNELIAKRDINIGLAVETPEGLIVPVIKNADRRSMVELAGEIERLAEAARTKKLKLDEVRGGTFTITNIGSIGGFFSTPIIDPPEVAILGVHRIKDLPLVVNGYVVARKVMGLSICFDHRVVDGAIATEFMNVVKQHLEDPDLLLVDMT
jgi:pyruvate dehydrogenase E2 component (dihydrolipoamide acetyltransferase)